LPGMVADRRVVRFACATFRRGVAKKIKGADPRRAVD